MNLELIDKIERLRKIQPFWEELLSVYTGRDFFLMHQWFFAWWDIYGNGKKLFVLALWEGDQLMGLFLLYKISKGPFIVITFAGQPIVSDRMDFILRPGYEEECLLNFISWLFSRFDWDIMILRDFASFSLNPEILCQKLTEVGKKTLTFLEAPNYYISLNKFRNIDSFLNVTTNKKSRKRLRYKERRLSRYKSVEWNILFGIDDSLVDEMEDLVTKRSIRGLKDKSYFSNPKNTLFLKRLSREPINQNNILLFTLRIKGELCAYRLIFQYDNKLLCYQTSFDMNFSKLSIGNQITYRAIEYAFVNGYNEVDFLKGDEKHKKQYTDDFHQNKRLLIYRGGLKSHLLYFYHNRIKPLRRSLGAYPMFKKVFPESFLEKWDL